MPRSSALLLRLAPVVVLLAAGCGDGTVFTENFNAGTARWSLGKGFSPAPSSVLNPADQWLTAVYDDSCADQDYNFAYVLAPFDFGGAASVTVSHTYLGVYGKNDTTGLAWTTDAPGPNATWNSLSELGTTDVLLTSTVTLPDAARKTGVYLGIYFRNICVRGSVGVNMGYDDFKVVVK